MAELLAQGESCGLSHEALQQKPEQQGRHVPHEGGVLVSLSYGRLNPERE